MKQKSCPLCVGNEALTPPAVLIYFNENGKIRKGADIQEPRKKTGSLGLFPTFFLLLAILNTIFVKTIKEKTILLMQ